MTRIAVLIAMLITTESALAGGPFSGSRLFVNPSMKYDVGRTLGVGVNFTIAPVKAAQKKLVEQFKAKEPEKYDVVLQAAQHVDPEDIKGRSGLELEERLLAVESLSEEQKAVIRSSGLRNQDTQTAQQLFEIMTDPDTTITFSFEPYLELHLGAMDLTVIAPLAGFSGDDTEFALGNIGVDMRFGHIGGDSISGGISYGIRTWAPTASSNASNALGLANLLWSPRYFYEYTTLAPYIVLGTDLKFLTLQANVAYNTMFAVKGEPKFDQVMFLEYGFSAAVTAIPMLIISAEVSGLSEIDSAPAYDSVFFTTGLRLVSSIIDLGIGAQFPITKADASKHAAFSNLSFGSPSDFNIILSGTIGI